MKISIEMDQDLIEQAVSISGFKTETNVINTALREFINRRKQIEITALFWKFNSDLDDDYKTGRR